MHLIKTKYIDPEVSKRGDWHAYGEVLEKAKHAAVPPLWDGKAAERIWEIVRRWEGSSELAVGYRGKERAEFGVRERGRRR
ncbi:MAG: hypothetical protein ABIJ52_00235 [Pseudomonadota bacterium]